MGAEREIYIIAKELVDITGRIAATYNCSHIMPPLDRYYYKNIIIHCYYDTPLLLVPTFQRTLSASAVGIEKCLHKKQSCQELG